MAFFLVIIPTKIYLFIRLPKINIGCFILKLPNLQFLLSYQLPNWVDFYLKNNFKVRLGRFLTFFRKELAIRIKSESVPSFLLLFLFNLHPSLSRREQLTKREGEEGGGLQKTRKGGWGRWCPILSRGNMKQHYHIR